MKIAIVGGGPAGSFFAKFVLDFAKQKKINLSVTIFDGKKFLYAGPRGCNMCAGVIAAPLLGRLSEIGIEIPERIIQRNIRGYALNTAYGDVKLYPKSKDARIITVYRGSGPAYSVDTQNISFDEFLLDIVRNEGAEVIQQAVLDVALTPNKAILKFGKDETFEADFVAVACGLNTGFLGKIEALGFGYKRPKIVQAGQMELMLGNEYIEEHFSNMIYTYKLGLPNIRFAALVPKKEHVTVTVVGERDIKKSDIWEFLLHPMVKKDLPKNFEIPEQYCHCYPRIPLRKAHNAFSDRIVMIGDTSYTRFYKNGLESALWTARYAAKAIFTEGFDKRSLKRHFFRLSKKYIIRDNIYGRILFWLDKYISSKRFIAISHIQTAKNPMRWGAPEKLRGILWDMLTGDAFYRQILIRALDPLLQLWLTIKMLLNFFSVEAYKQKIASIEATRYQLRAQAVSRVGIIGAGPAGCAAAIMLKKLSREKGRETEVLLFGEKKDKPCVGVLSPPLSELLKKLDVTLPDDMEKVVIHSYLLHGEKESVHLEHEEKEKESTLSIERAKFDEVLLNKAVSLGVTHIPENATDLNILKDTCLIHTPRSTKRCDVIIGAFGLNNETFDLLEKRILNFRRPDVLESIIANVKADDALIRSRIGETLHVFLLRGHKRLEFAAVTPKKDHMLINVAGTKIGEDDLFFFLSKPYAKALLKDIPATSISTSKGSFPVSLANNFYADRFILIGDSSGLVRPYKGKGINTAISAGVMIAEMMLDKGISKKAFERFYRKNSNLIEECFYGWHLRTFLKVGVKLRLIDPVIKLGRMDLRLYWALYNIVSGSRSYKDTVKDALSLRLLLRLARSVITYPFNK